MPIQFPLPVMGRPEIRAANLIQKPFDYVPAPNLANPNYRFTSQTLDGGRGKIFPRANPRWPNFAIAVLKTDVDPRPQILTDARLSKEEQGTLNMVMSGTTRDNTGAALGSCRVMIFRTGDNSFVTETTSDASGAWSVSLLKGGPFFQVCYKAGGTDVAGTSLNTLAPVVTTP